MNKLYLNSSEYPVLFRRMDGGDELGKLKEIISSYVGLFSSLKTSCESCPFRLINIRLFCLVILMRSRYTKLIKEYYSSTKNLRQLASPDSSVIVQV